MFRVYLDACVINRITDDLTQPRVLAEAEAILEILRLITNSQVQWIASDVLATELLKNPNAEKLEEALNWLARAGPRVTLTDAGTFRATELQKLGYGLFDALHLACAEENGATALLTTDDRFLSRAARAIGNPAVPIANPLNWLREVQPWFPSRK